MISIITSTKSLDKFTAQHLIDEYNIVKDAGVDFELIIQDCLSDPVLINELNKISYISVKSEPDSGIYDAWNKALPRIKGDKVCFLGVDDTPSSDWLIFADKSSLNEYEVIVCDVDYRNQYGRIVGTYKNPTEIKLDMRVAKYLHPGCIFSASLYENRIFKSQYKIISDGLFYAQMPFATIKSNYNKSGVLMTIGGTSNSSMGARRRMHEYIAAFRDGDIEVNINMFNRFFIGNLPQYFLSFAPGIYNVIQLLRMKVKYKINKNR